MMDAHDLHDDRTTELDPKREWAVYRCAHGCFHLSLDRIMVRLTEHEFNALLELMRRASRQLGDSSRASALAQTH